MRVFDGPLLTCWRKKTSGWMQGQKGKPKKSDYRKFKIKSVSGPDDYGCMKEVLTRRFVHGMEESRELKEKNIRFHLKRLAKEEQIKFKVREEIIKIIGN